MHQTGFVVQMCKTSSKLREPALNKVLVKRDAERASGHHKIFELDAVLKTKEWVRLREGV